MSGRNLSFWTHQQGPSATSKSTFDFGTRIGYLNNALAFYYCSHEYQLGKAGSTDIVNLDINDGSPATVIT